MVVKIVICGKGMEISIETQVGPRNASQPHKSHSGGNCQIYNIQD